MGMHLQRMLSVWPDLRFTQEIEDDGQQEKRVP